MSYVPPQNLEAEEAVIAGILRDGAEAIEKIALDLRPEDFYDSQRGLIYKACLDLYVRNIPIDTLSVGAELDHSGLLSQVGGRARIAATQLQSNVGGLFIEHHAGLIQDAARLRKTLKVFNDGIRSIVQDRAGATQAIDHTIKKLFDLATDADESNVERIGERSVGSFIESLNQVERPRLKWPWPKVDSLLSGLWPSEMTVVCGRPAMAKTSFAMNLALFLAMDCKIPVCYFSLEMSNVNLVNRMLSQLANVDSVRLRDHRKDNPVLSDEEMQRVLEASIPLSEAPLFVDDTPGLTETDLVIKSRRKKWQDNIGCVIIDYIQLLRPSAKFVNREQEVSSFSATARYVARELQIPVVVLCQLNRGPEARSDHRPLLSDIRESGALEQDADVVIGLYRDHYYNPEADPNEAEVIVLKHRNGPTDTVKLGFDKRLTKFYSLRD
jgi:replicative DNA helicase